MANLPAIVSAAERATIAATTKAAPSAGRAAMRTVGESRIDDAVALKAAEEIMSLPAAERTRLAKIFSKKGLIITGGVVATGAAGIAAVSELADNIANSPPETLLELVNELDSKQKDSASGDAVAAAYNQAVHVSQLDTDFSDARSQDGYLSQAPVSGIGLDREQIEAQQAILAQYNLVRSTLMFEQIIALQFLFAHAKPSELATLEDMRQNGRR